MKYALDLIIASVLVLLLTSCQTPPSESSVAAPNSSASGTYHAQIKSDKKKQAELDLPFRGFNDEKNIQTIAFGSPETNCWDAIQKSNPELMILTSAPEKNLLKLPEYRSIREKVPFMCTPTADTKTDFIRNWPYVKNIIPESQNGIYHAKIFGTKKNQIQVIMIDQIDSDQKWAWLENEFKKPTALKILTGPTQNREKVLTLIKKAKAKNLILLPNDRPVSTFAKTDIKDLGSIYETTAVTRTVASEAAVTMPTNFGLIRINWAEREAQLEIRNIEDQKVQVVELKF